MPSKKCSSRIVNGRKIKKIMSEKFDSRIGNGRKSSILRREIVGKTIFLSKNFDNRKVNYRNFFLNLSLHWKYSIQKDVRRHPIWLSEKPVGFCMYNSNKFYYYLWWIFSYLIFMCYHLCMVHFCLMSYVLFLCLMSFVTFTCKYILVTVKDHQTSLHL